MDREREKERERERERERGWERQIVRERTEKNKKGKRER